MAELHVSSSPAADHPGWWRLLIQDNWAALRNRLLGNSRFQQWSSRFPLTRPIARSRAQALFDLCSGFVYSQVLYACVQCDLFETLHSGPRPLEDLANSLQMETERAAILLEAAVALELLENCGDRRYGLGPLGAVLVANKGIQAIIRHHAMFYEDLRDPLALLRGVRGSGPESGKTGQTRLAGYWPYGNSSAAASLGESEVSPYSELMTESQNLVAEEVLASYSMRPHQTLLDVGGGLGAFVTAIGRHWRHLQLQLFDLPAVALQAGRRLAETPLSTRFTAYGGNFQTDPLPQGADIISLVRILHDHDDADVLQLLRSVRSSLPGNGTLLLAEPMAGEKSTDRMARAYFGLYLLAMGTGRPRTPREIAGFMRQAGFSRVRLLQNSRPMQTRIMVAHP